MTPPPRSLMGTIAAVPARTRRLVLLGLTVLFLLLTYFPEKYHSAATLAPADPSAFGLGGATGQLGAATSVFGNQAAVEVTIRIANSVDVRNAVIDRLKLMDRLGKNRLEANRWIGDTFTVRSLRGGIVLMEATLRDAKLADDLVKAVYDETRQRLAVINRQQTSYKRRILEQLVEQSGRDYDVAQRNYDNFRRQTRYSEPANAISAIGGRIPVLQASIRAKEVQLNAARQFATDDNMSVRQIQAEIEALQIQLAQQRALDPNEENSVGRVVKESTEAEALERKLDTAKSLYENYRIYLSGTAVEDLIAPASLRIIEPPYIDTTRQLNLFFLGLTVFTILIGFALEFYRLRPPLEAYRA